MSTNQFWRIIGKTRTMSRSKIKRESLGCNLDQGNVTESHYKALGTKQFFGLHYVKIGGGSLPTPYHR